MIPYTIIPPFHLGPLMINMYGILFASGALVATLLAVREAKKRGVHQDVIYDLVAYLLIGGLIGARLFYVFFYWPEDMALTFLDLFKIWEGGLAWFGGFLGALAAYAIYLKRHKLDFWQYADIFVVPLVVGHISGRVGDYLTGAHPGKVTDLPWAIYLDGALRHPVVLYEILGLMIIVLTLLYLKKRAAFNGFLFLSYVMLYAIQRLVLDVFRIEATDPRFFGLTPAQLTAIILFGIAGYLMITKLRNKKEVK